MSTLSVCLIVKNEAKYIKNCLESIHEIADQVVVVDTGSNDDTISIAKSFKATIGHFNWIDDFSAARNKSLELATGDWILHIDADETLDVNSPKHLLNLINSQQSDAFELSVRNYHPAQDMVSFQDSHQIRLFRNQSHIRFQNRVHEQIFPALRSIDAKIHKSDLLIHHYGYQHDNQLKAERNLPILESILEQNPNDVYSWFKLGETFKALNRTQNAMDAFNKALNIKNSAGLDDISLEMLFTRQSQLELQQDHYLLSLKTAEKSLNLNPDNPLTLYIASVSALYLNQVELAYQYLNHLKQVDHINNTIPGEDVNRLLAACKQLNGGDHH